MGSDQLTYFVLLIKLPTLSTLSNYNDTPLMSILIKLPTVSTLSNYIGIPLMSILSIRDNIIQPLT